MGMKQIAGRPYNGIDVSHWNGAPPVSHLRSHVSDWLKFMGIKATHMGNKYCPDGVDPRFVENRVASRGAGVPYVGMYAFLTHQYDLTDQALLLAETVGTLLPGEFVFLDWEDHAIESLDVKLTWHMDKLFPGRWAAYVNDSTPAMTRWLENAKNARRPIIHPDWTVDGWAAADKWAAMIWQVGIAPVEGYANPIDIDFVCDEDRLRWLTKR